MAHTNHRLRSSLLHAIVAVGITIISLHPPAAVAAATAPVDSGDSGDVVVVDDNRTAIGKARSATEFSLRLPDGAACPGDSANDQWRVQSFVIPSTNDPASIEYGSNGPTGVDQYSLYELNTRPMVDAFTSANIGAGKPGVIPAIALFSFGIFPPGTLPDGRYRVGIACTYFRETARFWDTEIIVTSDSDDQPGQMVWTIPDAAETSDQTDVGFGRWLVLGGASLGVFVAGGSITWRRTHRRAHRRTTTLLKENS